MNVQFIVVSQSDRPVIRLVHQPSDEKRLSSKLPQHRKKLGTGLQLEKPPLTWDRL
jgi:hypothetical protein